MYFSIQFCNFPVVVAIVTVADLHATLEMAEENVGESEKINSLFGVKISIKTFHC